MRICRRVFKGLSSAQNSDELRAFIFTLYFQDRVPQNKIEKILQGMGIEITDSEIGRMLIAPQPELDQEHEQARTTAFEKSEFAQVDDTGARILINGSRPGHTIVTSTPKFCAYSTGESKDRMNVVQALLGVNEEPKFLVNRTSLQLVSDRVPRKHRREIERWARDRAFTRSEIERKLRTLDYLTDSSRQDILSALAIAAYRSRERGRPKILVCDDATNFKRILPEIQLCWVHEIRRYRTLYSFGTVQEELLQEHLDQMIKLYKILKRYKIDPSAEARVTIEQKFNELFNRKTPMNALNEQLRLSMNRRRGLLTVLEHPFVPLHNNESETDLRERVLKRRISYGNRSWAGVSAWDRQLGILHTCRKLHVSYWEFLKDRFRYRSEIPRLSRLIQVAA